MIKYHKIQTVYKRDPDNNHRTLLEGVFSIPEFDYLKGNQWVFTEKVDGTNIRIMYTPNEKIKYGGKSDNAQIPSFLLNNLLELFDDQQENFVKTFGDDTPVCLYGEGYGAKIQKGGGNYRQDQSFVLFDVLIGGWWLQREDVEEIAQKLSVDSVPIIGEGNLIAMIERTRNGFDSQWGNFRAEGIVARPKTELKTRSGHRIITKIKCKDFA